MVIFVHINVINISNAYGKVGHIYMNSSHLLCCHTRTGHEKMTPRCQVIMSKF
jgi:hypothetical protein